MLLRVELGFLHDKYLPLPGMSPGENREYPDYNEHYPRTAIGIGYAASGDWVTIASLDRNGVATNTFIFSPYELVCDHFRAYADDIGTIFGLGTLIVGHPDALNFSRSPYSTA